MAEKDTFIIELKDLIAKLEGQVLDYRRSKFGPKSEKLDPAQLELALEDLDTFDDDLPPKAIMKRTPSDFGKNHDPRRARAKDLTHAALREPDSTIAPEIHICIALMNRFNALGTADIVRLA